MIERFGGDRVESTRSVQLALLAAVPFPAAVPLLTGAPSDEQTQACGLCASVLLIVAFILVRRVRTAAVVMVGAAMGLTAFPFMHLLGSSPALCLFAGAFLIAALFAIFDGAATPPDNADKLPVDQRWTWRRAGLMSSLTVVLLGCVMLAIRVVDSFAAQLAVVLAVMAPQFALIRSTGLRGSRGPTMQTLYYSFLGLLMLAPLVGLFRGVGIEMSVGMAVILAGLFFWSTIESGTLNLWWTPLLNNPARMLALPFLMLCAVGTGLLMLPLATVKDDLSWIDAAFTSTSAVCVTGLIVRDTPVDFTWVGQGIILLLIQIGGLGIMTISVSAFQLLGRRMNLHQEYLMSSIAQKPASVHRQSLFRVLRFTLIVEAAGAVLLTGLFWQWGDGLGEAIWRGVFTSISAFCNAGFALQSDSLMGFSSNPAILHVVAVLIVTGGLAPATVLAIPALLRRQRIPPAACLALVYTTVLLGFGFVMILSLEWSHGLGGMTTFEKLNNAWFQSVTLRTAGFNTIDIGQVTSPTLLVMMMLMFIGGSPGGTAGGVKTVTVGVLFAAMWTTIAGRKDAEAHG